SQIVVSAKLTSRLCRNYEILLLGNQLGCGAGSAALRRRRGRSARLERERELLAVEPDRHGAAVLEAAEQDLVREGIAHLGLDDAAQRTRAHDGIEPLLREPGTRLRQERDRHAPLRELGFELQDELVDDRLHHVGREALERDDRVEAVAELGVEQLLQRLAP